MLPSVTATQHFCRAATGHARSHLNNFRRPRRNYSINYSQMFRMRLNAEQVGRKFEVSDDELTVVARRMSDAMDAGLWRNEQPGALATIRCWDTRVPRPSPPAATDAVVRKFLSLDLCHGDRFRTRFTTLLGAHDVWIRSREHPLTPRTLMTGKVANLFDHVAGGLAEFADEFHVRRAGVPLALTFGFPVWHAGALGGVASLCRWTKGFDCADAMRQDVAAEWRAAAARADVVVGPVAVLNDACVAMMHSAADRPDTRAALVVDDGCNCCYVSEFGRTVINTEWGAFGEDGALDHLLTEYDRRLDARSQNPSKQIYEKMTSGMYMAELVRMAVLEIASNQAMFEGRTTTSMDTEYALKAKHLWLVESDTSPSYDGVRAVLTGVLNVTDPSDMDCELFRYVCRCVTRRSANLIAAGLSAVLRRTGLPVTVVMAGHAFKTHSEYALAVGGKARQMTQKQTKFTLRTVDHTQGQDARIVARVLATIPANPA
ncbi:glucokinase-like [Myzus persicae]|uniref:glucokinase-like n=1 Tax=Myzus persicae TaxID=13164 RepID=UPI000B931C54|nr:glucokinase-like [Myzus persicae]